MSRNVIAATEGLNAEGVKALTLKTDGTVEMLITEIGVGNSRLGTLILLAAETMMFGGFFAALVVLTGGEAASRVADPMGGWWLLFAVGCVALFTIESARRSVEKGGRLLPIAGINLVLVAGVGWLILSSPAIIGLGAGPWSLLSTYTPAEACRLALHTLLALHIVLTLLLTAIAVIRLLRSAVEVKEYLVRVEILWAFALIVQGVISVL